MSPAIRGWTLPLSMPAAQLAMPSRLTQTSEANQAASVSNNKSGQNRATRQDRYAPLTREAGCTGLLLTAGSIGSGKSNSSSFSSKSMDFSKATNHS